MRTNTFGRQLLHFVESVDHVTEGTFRHVLTLMATYAHQHLGFSYFEFMRPHLVNGEAGLITFANYLDGKRLNRPYATEILDESEQPRIQSALAFHKGKRLWLVSQKREPLANCPEKDIEDQWSDEQSLPRYKQNQVLVAKTSVIVPVDRGSERFGVVDFEGEAWIPRTKIIEEEMMAIADCIAQLWLLYQALEAQNMGTDEALDELNDILASGMLPDLGTARLFLAYPGRCKEDVLDIIRSALKDKEFAERIRVVDWRELYKPGNVTLELLQHIDRCRFGLCYFSEQIDGENDSFQDNPNVLFEAGMLHALTNRPVGPPRGWIPIREANSPVTPFDFASERMIIVHRDAQGAILAEEQERIAHVLGSMLINLLEIS